MRKNFLLPKITSKKKLSKKKISCTNIKRCEVLCGPIYNTLTLNSNLNQN